MANKPKFYVVWKGATPGIYKTWADCQAQIKGYPDAKYKSYGTLPEAQQAYGSQAPRSYTPYRKPKPLGKIPNTIDGLAVDAACSGNPGVLEYQAVMIKSRKLIFKRGPFPLGTVNIGEFLAVVHALALLKQHNKQMPIYSDSLTALAWVRNKRIKTNLPRNAQTKELFKIVDRAVAWLHANPNHMPVHKWPTEKWGEIPADFGRK